MTDSRSWLFWQTAAFVCLPISILLLVCAIGGTVVTTDVSAYRWHLASLALLLFLIVPAAQVKALSLDPARSHRAIRTFSGG